MNYRMYIEEYATDMPLGVPIYNENIAQEVARKFNMDITKAIKLVNVNMQRLFEKGKLERYQKGIYYRAAQTPFGKTKLNPNIVIDQMYLKEKDKIIGYTTDASFINNIGLSTQIPKYRYIATNKFKAAGYRKAEKEKIALRKPNVNITNDNYRYLQLLDVLENRTNTPIDASNPHKILLGYINKNKLDFMKLIAYAGEYYSQETLVKLAEIAKEGIR